MPVPRRADAQRNRDRLLEVAADALRADPETSLNQIAKRAGLGPGTLYRHFPTRPDLLMAVYGREVVRLSETVGELLESAPPVDALKTWFKRLAEYLRLKHGLGEALSSPAALQAQEVSYGPVIGAIEQLLDAGRDAGQLRPDLEADDVLMLMSCLWRVPSGADGLAQADRLLDAVVAGLRR